MVSTSMGSLDKSLSGRTTETDLFAMDDPMGFEAGDSNLYRYAGNDPTNATDPTGLFEAQNSMGGVVNVSSGDIKGTIKIDADMGNVLQTDTKLKPDSPRLKPNFTGASVHLEDTKKPQPGDCPKADRRWFSAYQNIQVYVESGGIRKHANIDPFDNSAFGIWHDDQFSNIPTEGTDFYDFPGITGFPGYPNGPPANIELVTQTQYAVAIFEYHNGKRGAAPVAEFYYVVANGRQGQNSWVAVTPNQNITGPVNWDTLK